MQIHSLNIERQSSYSSTKPNQLLCTVELRDVDGNRQSVSLDDNVTVAILEVIREATVAKCKVNAALAKSALDSAIAAPALESAATLKLED
jgi:hypothetical protein